MTTPFFITLFIPLSVLASFTAHAAVPPSKTFKYINHGDFGEYIVEYHAYYRPLDIAKFPFLLCFYNATPNAYILGLRMGHRRSESIMRWVWDANRGKPVHENTTLTFGSDRNLVLADVDGTVAWQTGTANKGVVGLDLLPNGNLVLHNSKGEFVWQSFDHPTDTLLVGQSVRATGPNWLISRASDVDPSNGPYTFGMEKRFLAMYYQSEKSYKPLLCYKSDDSGTYTLSRPKYNSTYLMLRVDVDGNLRIYTYDENVDWGAWEVTYVLFDRDDGHESECQLLRRCGSLGVCEDDQCVACPKPQGLLGWSKSCAPPALPPCKGGANMDYCKVEGVEHYTSAYKEGDPMKLMDCRAKCNKDCKCLGFFYRAESSKCLLVADLGTLIKVSNASHVGYIKVPK
ncbi:hypothetical protein NMG60_11012848 [Bertholletia excelsa]